MELSAKERVYQALKERNYFDFGGKKDSLEVFEMAEHLEDVIIQVERYCNVDKLLFRYNPVTNKFYRVILTEKDEELLERERLYKRCGRKKCTDREINVDSFIELLKCEFEPIAIYQGRKIMKTIVFASWNPKKAAEMQRMAPEGIKIVCLKDIPEASNVPQADENGATFLENSTIKAKYWAEKLNMAVLAEDSGIAIDALNGYPGVYTKRCLEQLCSGANVNVDKPSELYPVLLELMEESGNPDTVAHWISAMTFIDSDRTIYAEESLHGDMCSCAGKREFGFDQYFKAKGFDKTLSELAPEEKDKIGPRKKAFESILNQF